MNEFLIDVEKNSIGKIEKDVSLKKYTTYKVGGMAKCIIYPKNTDKLVQLIKLINKYNLKFKILGKGSNLLFSDNDFNDIIIKLDCFDNVTFNDNRVTVGAGFSLMKLSLLAAKRGLAGLEFASGIPGTVGGAIYMNAGAYKSDMGYITSSVKVLTPDLKIIELVNSELDFHYRSSFFQKHRGYICLEADLKLANGNKEEIEKVIKDRRERRISTQPLEYPSAGSVFRNPSPNQPAGKIIEDLGLKGLTKGGAQISKRHANFIINIGNASAKDVKELISFIKETVKDEYDIDLKVEQEFVNWE